MAQANSKPTYSSTRGSRGSRDVPLAWLNLTHNRVRMLLFCAGIGFAVVLMFIQLGCLLALLDSSVLLHDKIRADLFLVGEQQTTLLIQVPISRSLLVRAQEVPGVASVYPLYVEYTASSLRNASEDQKKRKPNEPIRVIGVDPQAFLLDFPALDPNSPKSKVEALLQPGNVLFDLKSKPQPLPDQTVYGPVIVGTTRTDLSGKNVRIVGGFELGIDFGCNGSLIVNTQTFRDYLRPPFYGAGLEEVDLGLVRLKPGQNLYRVQEELQRLYEPNHIKVLTKSEFRWREQTFWLANTPIGSVFGFGVLMGGMVGVVICYQILSSDIRDNLGAYATLRAIGYPNEFLTKIVLQESLILAGLGFIPGFFASWALYAVLGYYTALPMTMLEPWRIGFVLIITVAMCVLSGLLAVRQAQQADPAEVF